MSDDTIKRSDAIKALKREKSDWNNDYNVPIDHCIERLNKVKSADRPQGEWIDDGGIEKCNQCGERKEFPHWNFCPNCGCAMTKEDE